MPWNRTTIITVWRQHSEGIALAREALGRPPRRVTVVDRCRTAFCGAPMPPDELDAVTRAIGKIPNPKEPQ